MKRALSDTFVWVKKPMLVHGYTSDRVTLLVGIVNMIEIESLAPFKTRSVVVGSGQIGSFIHLKLHTQPHRCVFVPFRLHPAGTQMPETAVLGIKNTRMPFTIAVYIPFLMIKRSVELPPVVYPGYLHAAPVAVIV